VVFMYLGSILWFFVNIADFIPTENCIAFCVHNVWLWDIYPDDVKRDPDDALYPFFHVAESLYCSYIHFLDPPIFWFHN
jgi:hypothetical protein